MLEGKTVVNTHRALYWDRARE